ncbi:MAG TPA: hypothetical protein DDW52_22700 [Planctomycetaceae bacterium]|nr:hypothetical protein [Planctomycetaceae bacterium]
MLKPLSTIAQQVRRHFSRSMPARQATSPEQEVDYDKYWQVARGSYSERFVDQVCQTYDFQTVLDGGSGVGVAVRQFMSNGKDVKGVEYSSQAIEEHCSDLEEAGIVQQGTLMDLPFDDNTFDLVFSSEVLEHIEEIDAGKAVSELVRVAKKHLFLTISLRPSSDNNKYHVNLKSRQWWEQRFCEAGCSVEAGIVDQFQVRNPALGVKEIMEAGPTSAIMSELDWFIENPPYDLHGELEPWFFAFTKN